MWLNQPESGKSVTLTFFALGFVVALAKLLLSGVIVGSFTFQQFSGMDFAAVCGALGGIYSLRRMNDKKDDNAV